MQRYLVEVPYKNDKASCDATVNVFKTTGSHFLANTDFGCPNDVHKAWITIEAADRNEALRIVLPQFQNEAKIVKTKQFALEKVDKSLKPHYK